MEYKKSILSAAELIAEILSDNELIREKVKMFYPIIAPAESVCPYVVYRLARLYTAQAKPGHADKGEIEIMCCGSTVAQMIETSESVRIALDGIQAVSDDGSLRMRYCYLSGAIEGWTDGTFYRTLTFTVGINET